MKSLESIYSELLDANDHELLEKNCYYGLNPDQIEEAKKLGKSYYKGKVRELLSSNESIDIIHTDQLSAFDRYISSVPYKGLLLADIASFWFQHCASEIPNHFISMPHQRIMRSEKLQPIKVEVVVRGYMAGSMARSYEMGIRNFCGNVLEEGINCFSKLPKTIITPTTKAAAFEHDEETTKDQLIESGTLTTSDWKIIEELSYELFNTGSKTYKKAGYILVDTKYEFGKTPDGQIKVIDEIHTPDSSRLWVEESYATNLAASAPPQMLDKENIRRYLMANGFSGKGKVPHIPVEELIKLSKTYLSVRNELIGDMAMIGPQINKPI